MYHYRWTYDPDIEKAGKLLPLDQNLQLADNAHAKAHDLLLIDRSDVEQWSDQLKLTHTF